MLPDWCTRVLNPVAKINRHVADSTAPHHVATNHPQLLQMANVHTQGAPSRLHQVANFVRHPSWHNAPLWLKKTAIISVACLAPPLALDRLANSSPAGPAAVGGPASLVPVAAVSQVNQVPEPSTILLMAFGLVVIFVLARGRMNVAFQTSDRRL